MTDQWEGSPSSIFITPESQSPGAVNCHTTFSPEDKAGTRTESEIHNDSEVETQMRSRQLALCH